MEQQDRDLLIRIDERMNNMLKLQAEHKQESKESLFAMQSELKTHGTRLTKLEEQKKPLIYKLFAYLFMAKGG